MRVTKLVWLVVLVFVVGACGASARDKALRSSIVVVNAARDGFTAWDATEQQRIVDAATDADSGKAKLLEHQAARDRVARVIETAYRAIGFAALANDDASMKAMLQAMAALKETLTPLLKESK